MKWVTRVLFFCNVFKSVGYISHLLIHTTAILFTVVVMHDKVIFQSDIPKAWYDKNSPFYWEISYIYI